MQVGGGVVFLAGIAILPRLREQLGGRAKHLGHASVPDGDKHVNQIHEFVGEVCEAFDLAVQLFKFRSFTTLCALAGAFGKAGGLVQTFHDRYHLAAAALEIEGPAASLYLSDERAPVGGQWALAYMNSFGATIAAGTSEIQRNILGERVLGLPKS